MANGDLEKYFWRDFIAAYRRLPALWMIKSSEYKDRRLKDDGYDELVVVMRRVDPNADRETVRRKINGLRTGYRRELRKMANNNGTNGGSPYKPTLWYFEDMDFLRDNGLRYNDESEREERDGDDAATSTTRVVKLETSDSEGGDSQHSLDPLKIGATASESAVSINVSEQLAKRPRLTDDDDDDDDDDDEKQRRRSKKKPLPPRNRSNDDKVDVEIKTCAHACSPMGEIDILVRSWALDFAKLNDTQRMYAKKFISDVLFEGQLGNLHRCTLKSDPPNERKKL